MMMRCVQRQVWQAQRLRKRRDQSVSQIELVDLVFAPPVKSVVRT
jgi:hypothetical protein